MGTFDYGVVLVYLALALGVVVARRIATFRDYCPQYVETSVQISSGTGLGCASHASARQC